MHAALSSLHLADDADAQKVMYEPQKLGCLFIHGWSAPALKVFAQMVNYLALNLTDTVTAKPQ